MKFCYDKTKPLALNPIVKKFFSSDGYKSISKEESSFLNLEQSEWWTGVVYPFF